MIDWILTSIKSTIAELVFFCICMGGAGFTLFSLIFGGEGEAEGAEGDSDVSGDHDTAEGDHGEGPGLLSLRGISLLMIGFGAFAFLIQHYTGMILVASFGGLFSGWIFAFLGLCVIRIFYRQQASSLIEDSQIIGAEGVVTTTIPKEGQGEVSITVVDRQIVKTAIAEGNITIPVDTAIKVVKLIGSMVVVKKVS